METLLIILSCGLTGIVIALCLRLLAQAKKSNKNAEIEDLLSRAIHDIRDDSERLRNSFDEKLNTLRNESSTGFSSHTKSIQAILAERSDALNSTLHQRFESFTSALTISTKEQHDSFNSLRESLNKSAGEDRKNIEQAIKELREENSKKLDEMRHVVDEKLQSTLEKRFNDSFKSISVRLDSVQQSFGEMQTVANNVSDLKRVLANVKTRGTWGEIQLGALLEDFLTPEQFVRNFKPKKGGNEIVEFAIKLPGTDKDANVPVYLPIDSKFPIEAYSRIVEASENADSEGVERASKELASAVEKFATDIKNKYINPPTTTNFAILFIPSEGIYAELQRLPSLTEKIRREKQVMITGPSTLAALINSLRVGFQTLTIQKKSAEIVKILGAVKKDFHSFGELLDKLNRKLQDAQSAFEDTAKRYSLTSRKLDKVESVDSEEEQK